MTILRVFLLLIVPLFLLLAGVNGALLYYSERAEAEKGLENQALSAAVTTAAFAAAAGDPVAVLTDPMRASALAKAAASIQGLDGLYLGRPDGTLTRIAGSAGKAATDRFAAPAKARSMPVMRNAMGRHVATALAPAAGGYFVVAQIDAEPLFAELATLEKLVVALLVGAGVVGVVLAWLVARRIARELARNSAMIEAIRAEVDPGETDSLAIRETQDLANAVRLMRTSVTGRLVRSDRERTLQDRQRTEEVAVKAYRETAFAPLSTTAAGRSVAARMLGQAPAGSFYALAEGGGRAALVLGECAGATPAEALARALAARRYFEGQMLAGPAEACVARGRDAFDLARVEWREWSSAAGTGTETLAVLDADNPQRAAAYARHGAGMTPDAMVDDLAALLAADGVVAVLGEPGQG